MKYRPEINGLRAVAVIPVILFHAGYTRFSGGFIGVDVFFVISGYLITTIILSEMDEGRFSLIRFYERRARRILPALFIVILVSVPFAYFWLLPSEMKDFSQSLIAVSSFSSNILFWRETGYWETASELKPLLHTWSLAIEEQYYVLFPLLLILLRNHRKRWIFAAFLMIIGFSIIAAQWGAFHFPSATFYLLPTRGWELAIGACIAFYFLYSKQKFGTLSSSRWIHELFGLLGLLMICYGIFVFDSATPFPSFYALIPTIGTGLIILFSSSRTIVGRILSTKLLVSIGLISYSAYLWHQPILAFTRLYFANGRLESAYSSFALLSLPLAYLSWRYIENPFRDKEGIRRRSILLFSIFGSIFFIIIGLAGQLTNGFESNWLSRQSEEIRGTYRIITTSKNFNNYGANTEGTQDDGACRFNIAELNDKIKKRLVNCFQKFKRGYAILGDSHAIDLFGVITSSNSHPFIFGITQAGCRPHTPSQDCYYDEFQEFVQDNPGMFYGIIYEQAGFYLLKTKDKKGDRSMIADSPIQEELKEIYHDESHIQKTFKYLRDLSNSVDVIWFGPRIEPHIPDRIILRNGCGTGFYLRPNQREIFEDLDSYISIMVQGTSSLQFVSQNEVFDYQFPSDFMDCDGIYWSDGDHLSALGEERFGKRFDIIKLFD